MVNASFNNTPRVMEVAMDISKDITESSVTTDSVIPPSGTLAVSGGVTVHGALTTTAPFTMAEGITLQSNDTNNTSTIWMHGSNTNHSDCSKVCTNGTTAVQVQIIQVR